MKKLLIIVATLWGAGSVGLWYWLDARSKNVSYRVAAVTRGDVRVTINATGTLEPEEVVDVGAQVAGVIEGFGADPRDPSKPINYGTPVEQGTVLARLEDALFKARVDQSKASLEKAMADVESAEARHRQAERDLERQKQLKNRGVGMVAAQDVDKALAEYDSSKAAIAVARASVGVAKANLEEATVNLGYTTIRSPVKGVILDRRVNIGQTVVASLNAPSLFLIAKDLNRMEIWASVNETDIGAIHAGQAVRFSVASLPSDSFEGRVKQVRLNASMVQNVVTYTVVVDVDNSGGRLLPYLTARLRFDVATRGAVLTVPNAALRWRPKPHLIDPDTLAEYRQIEGSTGRGRRTTATSSQADEGVLWVRAGAFVRPVRVTSGLTDGVVTEVSGEGVREGLEVVVGVERLGEGDEVYSILPHTQSDKAKK